METSLFKIDPRSALLHSKTGGKVACLRKNDSTSKNTQYFMLKCNYSPHVALKIEQFV